MSVTQCIEGRKGTDPKDITHHVQRSVVLRSDLGAGKRQHETEGISLHQEEYSQTKNVARG